MIHYAEKTVSTLFCTNECYQRQENIGKEGVPKKRVFLGTPSLPGVSLQQGIHICIMRDTILVNITP